MTDRMSNNVTKYVAHVTFEIIHQSSFTNCLLIISLNSNIIGDYVPGFALITAPVLTFLFAGRDAVIA